MAKAHHKSPWNSRLILGLAFALMAVFIFLILLGTDNVGSLSDLPTGLKALFGLGTGVVGFGLGTCVESRRQRYVQVQLNITKDLFVSEVDTSLLTSSVSQVLNALQKDAKRADIIVDKYLTASTANPRVSKEKYLVTAEFFESAWENQHHGQNYLNAITSNGYRYMETPYVFISHCLTQPKTDNAIEFNISGPKTTHKIDDPLLEGTTYQNSSL